MSQLSLRKYLRNLLAVALAAALIGTGLSQAAKPPRGGGGDSSRIAYFAHGPSLNGYPNTYQIWTMTPSGSGKTQVTQIPAQHMAPKWSSDGRLISCSQIPYHDGRFWSDEATLRIVNPRTGAWFDIVNSPHDSSSGYHTSVYALWSDHHVSGVRFAAEDQLLLVEADSPDGAQNLHVLQPDPAGSNLQPITFYPVLSPLNQKLSVSNPVWLPDAPNGSARIAYLERWVQRRDPYTDSNGNGQWDPGEPYTDANGDGEYTPFEELDFGPRVLTLDAANWPLVDVIGNDPLPLISDPNPSVNPPDFLFWNQTRTEVAWTSDGPGFWLAPVLYDEFDNPGIDVAAAYQVVPNTVLGGWSPVSFSPDGERFVFTDYQKFNALFLHVWGINTDGSGLKDLTSSRSNGEVFGPTWGPIGSGD